MANSSSMTRKEIAELLSKKRNDEVTTFMVRSNEKRWGLHLARLPDLNARVVRYDRAKVIKALGKL